MKINLSGIERKLDEVARQLARKEVAAARYTAWDIQRAAKRSIKSGGKNPDSKSYRVSKPGEPPRSHKGTLRNAIHVAKKDERTFIIGPEQRGHGSTLHTLEAGGTSTFRETFYDDKYVANIRKTRRRTAKDSDSTVRVHPKAKRPYTIRARHGRGLTVNDYVRFYSSEAWDRARNSYAFQSWAQNVRHDETTTVNVAARPYMAPAMRSETTQDKIAGRLARAYRL